MATQRSQTGKNNAERVRGPQRGASAYKRQSNRSRKRAPKYAANASDTRARLQERRQQVRETAAEPILVFGRPMHKEDLFRLAGLVVFFALMIAIVVLLWPFFGQFFEEGGRERMVAEIRNAGPLGVFMLLGIQVLQVVVAFIPGEVVQMVAGAMYGPVGGMAIILGGCLLSGLLIYEVVHRLGQPFVEAMVPTKYLDKFRSFEANGRLEPLVFVLFLIPGLPKDTFTYLVPLTNMSRNKYLAITTLARIPGVFMSTFAAAGFMDGNMRQAVIVIVVLAIVAGIGLLFKDRIIAMLDR